MTSLLARLAAGDPAATGALLDGCFREIARLAGPIILRFGVRGLIDGDDVANDVLFRIHRAARAGKLRIADAGDLTRLVRKLATTVVHKAWEANEAIKRGGRGARAGGAGGSPRAEDLRAPGRAIYPVDVGDLADQLLDRSTSPEDQAVVDDEAERFCTLLRDPMWLRIARLRLEGHTLVEIAQVTGRSVSSIERRMSQARALWLDSRDAG